MTLAGATGRLVLISSAGIPFYTPPHIIPTPPPTSGALSDLTLFMGASALALLIALLAWGEQIKNIAKDTRELEAGFLTTRKIARHELLPLLRPSDPSDRLVALTRLMGSGKLKTAPEVEVLGHFQDWTSQASRLRSLYSAKYWLTVGLTATLFVSGAISAWCDLTREGNCPLGLWLMVLPSALVVALFSIIVLAGRAEDAFADLLASILDRI